MPQSDLDLDAARRLGIQVCNRTRALTDLIAGREVISVAGSHGKSTTTTMLAVILDAAGLAAGHMVGGVSEALNSANARWGDGPLLVAETCEAFRGLDYWAPAHCLVTNVDDEHSEHYADLGALRAGFGDLVSRVPEDGCIVLCGDDPFLAGLAARLGDRVLTYGLRAENRVHPAMVRMTAEQCAFDLMSDGVSLGRVTLPVPGLHNLCNALGALAMAVSLGVEPHLACMALARFQSVKRRWQNVAASHGVRVFDDFAHHPTEIEATLALARTTAGAGRVHAVIEPQMISRVSRLAGDYAAALAIADRIWVLPLAPAGEIGDIAAAETQLQRALGRNHASFALVTSPQDAADAVCSDVQHGDVVVCMGPDLALQTAQKIAHRLCTMPAVADPALEEQPDTLPEKPGSVLRDRFDAQVVAQPDAVCAITETEAWTYARMAEEAARIAAALTARGIGRGAIVAVTMRKTLDFVAVLLGISMAGAAFATIDPRMTRPGMGRVLREAGTKLTLTDDPWRSLLNGFDAPLSVAELLETPTAPRTSVPRRAAPEDLACAIFTSGSTGVPRLVGMEHRNVVSYFDQCLNSVFVREDYRLMPATASISFDAILHQIFCTLSLGGTLLLVEDLAALSRSTHLDRITLLGGTPSTLRGFLAANPLPASVRTVNLGGEPTPPELLARLRQNPCLRKVWNLYGPAETTIATFAALLFEAGSAVVNDDMVGQIIGRPFAQVSIRVVAADGTDVAPGLAGELLIGGPTVGRGYLGAPEQTAERFFSDADKPTERWYRSGDTVRQRPDGSFAFLGREDQQVKINGARIELGEVRAALMGCPGVDDACVLVVLDGENRKRLVGFAVFDALTDVAFLREWLGTRHASMLMPHRIIDLPRLPLQINGKIDWQALLAMVPQKNKVPRDQQDRSGTPETVLAIWKRILQVDGLKATDDFRTAGGDSLAAMEIIMAVEEHFTARFPAAMIDVLTTPLAMAENLAKVTLHPAHQADDLLHRQRMYVSAWSGDSLRPDALLRTLNPGSGAVLFWVFQGNAEFTALSAALGPAVTVHGMRSGHLVMDYTAETIERLADAYVADIVELQPQGEIIIGGNCQGAVIARAIAFALRRRERVVSRLVLMELARLWKYDAPVDLIYGLDSVLNPYRNGADPTAEIAAAYPAGFQQHFIRGAHGAFFQPENVPSLAAVMRSIFLTIGAAT